MRSPCLTCELLHVDKNNPTCLNCKKRDQVCEIIDITEHTIGIEKMEPAHEEKKICKACGKLLPLSAYQKNKDCRDGHEGTCSKCRYQKVRAKALLDRMNEIQSPPEEKPAPIKNTLVEDRPLKINVHIAPCDSPPEKIHPPKQETDKPILKQDEPKQFPLSGPPVKTVIPPGTKTQTLSVPDNSSHAELSDQNCLISKNKSKAAHDQTDTFLPITQPSRIKTSNILKLCSIIDLLYPNGITTDQYSIVIPAILKIDQLL